MKLKIFAALGLRNALHDYLRLRAEEREYWVHIRNCCNYIGSFSSNRQIFTQCTWREKKTIEEPDDFVVIRSGERFV